MSVETVLALLISLASLTFGMYSGLTSLKRAGNAQQRRDVSELTMVIVKLEDISVGISEIKSDISCVKGEVRELTERLIVAEQQIRQANKRIDELQIRR